MRASSLSNAKVIDLLNRYFVSVHADGVFYKDNKSVAAEEKAAFQHVFQDLHRLNEKNKADGKPILSVGSVHAYVLDSAGKPLDSLHVAEAGPQKVLGMLEKAVKELKVPEGTPVVKPAPQSPAPKPQADDLVLHLTTGYLVPRNQQGARQEVDDDFVPAKPHLGTEKSGQWNALPSEDWIVMAKNEWRKLLPTGEVKVGASWEPDKDTAAWLLTRFYPTTENNDLSTNRIDQQELKATVLSVKDGIIRARLAGRLKMKHSFYPSRDDDNAVEANLDGYLEFDADGKRVRALKLTTDSATYGGANTHFGAALRSVTAAPN
jgi:hypothetical protein